MNITISAPFLKVPYKLLELYEQDADCVLNSIGLTKNELLDVQKRVPYETVYNLWLKVSQLIDDPCFGVLAAKVCHPTDLNALGYAWLSSSTLRTAFQRLYRFQAMVSEFIQLTLSETENEFIVDIQVKNINMLTMAQIDAGLAVILRMCQFNYGDDLKPSKVVFAHERPQCYLNYVPLFGANLKFKQPSNQLVFPIEIIDTPLLNSAPNLAMIADKTMIEYLQAMHEGNIASRVRRAIVEQLPSVISIAMIAEQLNMTTRTLHRHLKEQNTSFKEILDDVRFELSKQYIKYNQYNFTEIAFQLGFSDSSAFSRAFKGWSGQTPSDYRNH